MTSGNAIDTARLRLVVLTPETLERLLAADLDGASRHMGCVFANDFLATVNDVFLTRQLDGLRRRPLTPGWFARAIVRREDDRVIGHCGFHGDPADVGRAEIGYTVLAPFRRQGFATESAQGLVDWSRAQGSDAVFATIAADNAASIALVTRLGFRRSAVHLSRGAEEYVFELPLL